MIGRTLLCLALLAGCGGKEGTIALTIVVSPVQDPFINAATVKLTVGDSSHTKSFSVTNGHFEANLELGPLQMPGPVTIEAFDAANNLVARGRTPPLLLQPINQTVAVWVGRPGDMAPAAAALPRPLVEFAAAAAPGLGIVYAGGRTTDGRIVGETSIYDVLTHTIIPPKPSDPNDSNPGIPPLKNARAGAVGAVSLIQNVVVMGGSGTDGFGATGMRPSTVAESFSPVGSFGSWSSLEQPAPVASFAQVTVLGSGNALVSGGFDENGNRVDAAALLTTTGATALNALSTPMAAPRAGHAVAAAKFSDGEGALLIGGLADGSTAPLAERLTGQSFAAYEVPGLENRIDATATALSNGQVLVLGGKVNGVAVATGLLINTNGSPATVTALPSPLSTPRTGHTANRVGDSVLVCGGADATGKNVASCDLLDGTSGGLKSTIAMADARRGHSALNLETGLVVIAGGFNDAGQPLPSMEIYTE